MIVAKTVEECRGMVQRHHPQGDDYNGPETLRHLFWILYGRP